MDASPIDAEEYMTPSRDGACHIAEYPARLTDWRPRHHQHVEMRRRVEGKGMLWSSHEAREYVGKFANEIAQERRDEMDRVVRECRLCEGAGKHYPDYRYVVRCDAVSCSKPIEINPQGLGTGYTFNEAPQQDAAGRN